MSGIDDFTKAHQLYLEQLDKAYEKLRTLATDPDVLNPDWPEYKAAKERFNALQGDILMFKSVWYEVRELKEAQEDNGKT